MSSPPPSSSSRSSTPLDAHDERTLTILYATETGTAQDVADSLARLCRCLHIRARVISMDVYSPVRPNFESMLCETLKARSQN